MYDMILQYLISFAVCMLSAWCVVHGEEIKNLPGILETKVNFKQYSGYLTVDPVNRTRLFYWYVESQSDPVNDPLVMWLNGGPGCSSLGGFFGELGPFYVKSNLTLGINEYSWNKIANMLFLEAPAGVGFSKSDKVIPYNDEKTASDNLSFLLKFFEKYPHLKSLDFYITGESFAGHYIPTLAGKIVQHNMHEKIKINLQGLMIGNPLTVYSTETGGVVDYIYSHQLISNATYQGIREFCNFSFPGAHHRHYNPEKCAFYQKQAYADMGPINPYDIYADVCLGNSNGEALLRFIASSETGLSVYANEILKSLNSKLESPYYPCQGNFIAKYLNQPAVQKAIHAETADWVNCNQYIDSVYSKNDLHSSMIPFYNRLLRKGLKILIYSGDVDSVVPATSTRRWIPLLKLKLLKPWYPWYDTNHQVGGYAEVYDGLSFATVRDAGHEVPTFQPGRAYHLFNMFLKFKN